MDCTGKHVVVIGTKRSGIAAIELAIEGRARVVRAMDAMPAAHSWTGRPGGPADAGVSLEMADPDLIVLSPAVPYDLPMLLAARERGVSADRRGGTGVVLSGGPGDRHYGVEWKDDHNGADGALAADAWTSLPGGRKYWHAPLLR